MLCSRRGTGKTAGCISRWGMMLLPPFSADLGNGGDPKRSSLLPSASSSSASASERRFAARSAVQGEMLGNRASEKKTFGGFQVLFSPTAINWGSRKKEKLFFSPFPFFPSCLRNRGLKEWGQPCVCVEKRKGEKFCQYFPRRSGRGIA